VEGIIIIDNCVIIIIIWFGEAGEGGNKCRFEGVGEVGYGLGNKCNFDVG
jgi:hypothetical protein